jgi:hypothetical protein
MEPSVAGEITGGVNSGMGRVEIRTLLRRFQVRTGFLFLLSVFENYNFWKKFDFFAQKYKNSGFDRFLSLV